MFLGILFPEMLRSIWQALKETVAFENVFRKLDAIKFMSRERCKKATN